MKNRFIGSHLIHVYMMKKILNHDDLEFFSLKHGRKMLNLSNVFLSHYLVNIAYKKEYYVKKLTFQ